MVSIDIAPFVSTVEEEAKEEPQRVEEGGSLRATLRKAGLVMMIVTVMMSLISTGFTMFTITDISKVFASITFVCLILGFCILSVNALAESIFKEES